MADWLVFPITVPSLPERIDDLELLVWARPFNNLKVFQRQH
jgi:hypothetical protein